MKKYKFTDKKPVTSEFWYDICEGYLNPKDFSDDPDTVRAIKDAIKLLQKLESLCELE